MPISKVSRFVEDATFGYQDFARHGEDNPPTFRAQVGDGHGHLLFLSNCIRVRPIEFSSPFWPDLSVCRTTPGRTMVSLWWTGCTQTLVSCLMRSSVQRVTWPTTTWPVMRMWTLPCSAGHSSTMSTVCTASGKTAPHRLGYTYRTVHVCAQEGTLGRWYMPIKVVWWLYYTCKSTLGNVVTLSAFLFSLIIDVIISNIAERERLTLLLDCWSSLWSVKAMFDFLSAGMMIMTMEKWTSCWSAVWRFISKQSHVILRGPRAACMTVIGVSSATLRRSVDIQYSFKAFSCSYQGCKDD